MQKKEIVGLQSDFEHEIMVRVLETIHPLTLEARSRVLNWATRLSNYQEEASCKKTPSYHDASLKRS